MRPEINYERVPIDSITSDKNNARLHDERNLDAIKRSLKEFGQQKPIVVSQDGTVIAGNGTREAAQQLGWESIDIVRTDLKDQKAVAFAIADNRTAELASWDDTAISKALEELKSDEDIDELITGFTKDEIDDIINGNDDNPYSSKIESPIYTPKGECPDINELVDTSKTDKLKARIKDAAENGQIPKDVASFLNTAATRHSTFNYENIAEFYSHAPEEIRSLMEESALIIIDFDKAIELGFVSITRDMIEIMAEDYEE